MPTTAQPTVESIFEQISDALSTCRTLALMGQHSEAKEAWNAGCSAFRRHRDALIGYSGYKALEYAFHVTVAKLNELERRQKEGKQ